MLPSHLHKMLFDKRHTKIKAQITWLIHRTVNVGYIYDLPVNLVINDCKSCMYELCREKTRYLPM